MAYRKVFAMQKPWSVEAVKWINEWANGCWDDNDMKESRHSSLNKQMNYDSTNQLTSGQMNQQMNNSTNQGVTEAMNQ